MRLTCVHPQRLFEKFVGAKNRHVSTIRANSLVYSFLMMFSHQRNSECVLLPIVCCVCAFVMYVCVALT